MSTEADYPLFPLGAVLLPSGRLPMQIFEPRYLDLISRCMREDRGFGIVRITRGSEVAADRSEAAPELAAVGVEARIVDWDALGHGRLKIVVQGGRRFRLGETRVGPQRLTLATVEWIEEPELPTPVLSPLVESLAGLMQRLAEHTVLKEMGVSADNIDAGSLGWQLAQYLPFDEVVRYRVLTESDPVQRLEIVEQAVQTLSGERR